MRYCIVLVLLLSAVAGAQLEVGDDVKLSLNGALGVSYGGGFENLGSSSHSLNFNGDGNLSGSYYNPNFLSFQILPFYNRSQNNSSSQSIFDSSGLTATANLFTGSKFPGWVSFGKTINGTSEFGIPGLNGLETNGSSQSFSAGWSALWPGLPTLSASFSSNSNNSTLLGTTLEDQTATKSFNLTSSYRLKDWMLNGYFNHQTMTATFPDFLGNLSTTTDSSSNGYGINAGHSLPLHGSLALSVSRQSFSGGGFIQDEGATNNFNASATFNPTTRLTLTGDMRYITNVLGALQASVYGNSGVPILPLDNGSHSLSFDMTAGYALGHGFTVRGYASHQQQYYYGQDVSNDIYGGTINYNYAKPLLGMLYISFGLVNTANQEGNTGLGMIGSVSLNRPIGRWNIAADFSYAQDVQTLLALYTTSSMTYGGYMRRKIGWNTYWSASARAAHSGLTQQPGEGNSSYSFTSTLGWRRVGLAGGYATSSGTTVLTSAGLLTPTPVVGLINDNIVLYNAHSYTASVFVYPVRKMTIYATYANAFSNVDSISALSINKTEMVNSRLEYRLRKLTVVAGFTRYRQGISASGALPSVVNSYSIGISRWFNVF